MPFKSPESYELDAPEMSPSQPLNTEHRYSDEDSEVSDIEDFDPLKGGKQIYNDDASRPLRSVFDRDSGASFARRPLAWLDGQRTKGRWRRWCIPSRFCCILVLIFVATLVLILSAGGIWVYREADPPYGESEPWYPAPMGGTLETWKESYAKAAKLVDQMTLVEKVNVTTGTGWSMDMCVGNTGAIPRLHFPSLCLQDGPLGLRFADNITAFPAGITVGATWNKTLMRERGRAHGFEARSKGINVILGPSVGALGRLPAGGRNWEGFGSDPVLQGMAAAATIEGIQESGVIATIKHFVGNEQEHFRQSWEWGTPNAISSNIDDRTLHEIYAWPFANAIKAGVGSVMCSYNQINNSYACQNSKLMNGILKDELGFQGFVQSDWLAQRSGVAAALAGLDMSMPGDGIIWQDGKALWGHQLTKAVLNTSVPVDRLNDMTLRIVAAWYQLAQDDKGRWPSIDNGGQPTFSSWTNDKTGLLHPASKNAGNEKGVVNQFVNVRQTEEGGDHDALARRIAAEGIVLVKNDDHVFPLSRNGSGIVSGSGGKVKIGIFGEDAFSTSRGPNQCPDRSCNEGTLASGWGSGSVEFPYLISPAEALEREFDLQTVELTTATTNKEAHIDSTATGQDLCLVFINSDAGEGYLKWRDVKGDRNDLYPQKGGDDLVKSVGGSCGGNTVVVLHTVGPTILERWIDIPGVKAVLIAHLPGQESGNALADVLFGDVAPSGKLPYTIAKREEDYGPSSKILYYPNAVVPQQNFSEGLYFDYRYFDKHDIQPRYEFGFGLSYTSFKLSSVLIQQHMEGLRAGEPASRPDATEPPHVGTELPSAEEALWPKGLRKLKGYIYPWISNTDEVKKGSYRYPDGYNTARNLSKAGGGEGGNPDLYTRALTVSATLSNTGDVPGDCAVQLYISYPPEVKDQDGITVEMPVKVLRNFGKYHVGTANEEKRAKVKLELTRRDLSYWDVKKQNWVMPPGQYTIWLGFSSRDLPSKDSIFVR
ncbi:glycoside hydrolase family 3 protein [Polychaeton citri CBS 116435]|uniref:Probable beta-glucosidase E n=1 Tax=Polychaeton citri CBS 116435 TaxID=1314669 RepID=A0A9P4Q454_9PEZI|nr:glycoside hydrolase family 3 protein [Polychaeton citri CBS 116435]